MSELQSGQRYEMEEQHARAPTSDWSLVAAGEI